MDGAAPAAAAGVAEPAPGADDDADADGAVGVPAAAVRGGTRPETASYSLNKELVDHVLSAWEREFLTWVANKTRE